MNSATDAGVGKAVSLRPASFKDWPLIARWLAQPDIARWWGSRSAAEAEIRIALDTPTAICSVILVGDEVAGYGQAVDASLTGDEVVLKLPPGTWDISLFIGEPSQRGQGAGPVALNLMIREVFETTLAAGLSVVVPIAHEAAVRTYERAGFRWVRALSDPLFGPSWIMLLERPQR